MTLWVDTSKHMTRQDLKGEAASDNDMYMFCLMFLLSADNTLHYSLWSTICGQRLICADALTFAKHLLLSSL